MCLPYFFPSDILQQSLNTQQQISMYRRFHFQVDSFLELSHVSVHLRQKFLSLRLRGSVTTIHPKP